MIHKPIVFVDVETTGLSAKDGSVIEIGAIKVESGQITAKFHELLDPGMSLPRQITAITGLTDNDLFGKKQFRNVMEDFEAFLDGSIFAAHNVEFDYSFIKEEFQRNGNKLSTDRFCTAQLSRRLFPNERGHSLDKIILRHGYEVANRHRALDDAEVIAKFFIDMISQRNTDTYRILNTIIINSKPKSSNTSIRYVPLFE